MIGDNAQGKSNFLEAIYYSRRFGPSEALATNTVVAFHRTCFGSPALWRRECRRLHRQVAAAFEKKGKRKKVSLDGAEPDRMGDALGRLAAVIFSQPTWSS